MVKAVRHIATCAATVAAVGVGLLAQPGMFLPLDHPAIQYATGATTDTVATLDRRLRNRAASLSFDGAQGYLRSLLTALEISPASQTLVFSLTSLQSDAIGPATPRALYFNDTTMVGFVKGTDTIEIASQDPVRGVQFYQLAQTRGAAPRFARGEQCLQCHMTTDTQGVPGLLTFSTLPLSDDPREYAQGWPTDHRTPIVDRWGGWYVTGSQVPARHLGNVPVNHVPKSYVRAAAAPKLATVATAFDASAYLTPHSDAVALLVLNHQVVMTNLITRLGWLARIGESGARGVPPGGGAANRVDDAVRELVDYLLFVDEAPLPSPVRGSSSFAEEFAAKGPRDSKGRSLRDLDLTRRLLRYPCSYMIYSPAFGALPAAARTAVYERMWAVFSSKVSDPIYMKLQIADRRAIVEILRETKTDLPASFRGAL